MHTVTRLTTFFLCQSPYGLIAQKTVDDYGWSENESFSKISLVYWAKSSQCATMRILSYFDFHEPYIWRFLTKSGDFFSNCIGNADVHSFDRKNSWNNNRQQIRFRVNCSHVKLAMSVGFLILFTKIYVFEALKGRTKAFGDIWKCLLVHNSSIVNFQEKEEHKDQNL